MGACGLVSDEQKISNCLQIRGSAQIVCLKKCGTCSAGPPTAERSAEQGPGPACLPAAPRHLPLVANKRLSSFPECEAQAADNIHSYQPQSMPCCGTAWKPWMTFRQQGSRHARTHRRRHRRPHLPDVRIPSEHPQQLSICVCVCACPMLDPSTLMETDRKRIQTVHKIREVTNWKLLALASQGAHESTGQNLVNLSLLSWDFMFHLSRIFRDIS